MQQSKRARRAEAKANRAELEKQAEWLESQFAQNQWVTWVPSVLMVLPWFIYLGSYPWLNGKPMPLIVLCAAAALALSLLAQFKTNQIAGAMLYICLRWKKVDIPG